MIVFCNTTPFIALSAIGELDLLPKLFGKIHVVAEVDAECAAGGPIIVPDLKSLSWVEIVCSEPCTNNHFLLELDRGEKYTLHMAHKMRAGLVIIDEKIGRNVAEYMGLSVIGTLGILLNAKRKELIPSFAKCVASMRDHGIHYHPALVKQLSREAGE